MFLSTKIFYLVEMHYNSFAHAWRSQEKAITPFGLEFYFKFQSKWACLVTLTELVETPDFFLLPLLVL